MPEVKTRSIYGVHPAVKMVQNVIANMKDKTGRSLEEWIDLVQSKGPKDEVQAREWLKDEHKLGTNYAWWIIERSNGRGLEDGDPVAYLKASERHVKEMYISKPHLTLLGDALLNMVINLGSDVVACPCKTVIPFYRKHVFAQIKPTTKTRIDFGLALRDTQPTGRLISTGGYEKKDRITHRFAITTLDDINDEVRHWARKAYEMDSKI